jgi:hypothetical protein
MPSTVSPLQAAVFTKLGDFIVAQLGCPVVRGLDNQVPMPPASPGFVVMTAVYQERLRTNVDAYIDPFPTPGGAQTLEKGTRLDVQLDFYGASSGDWADILSTVLRDEYGCTALGPDVAPLYADEPRLMPLVDGEEQYEQRWLLVATLQYNPTVTTPQDFAGAADVTVINVEEAYPP